MNMAILLFSLGVRGRERQFYEGVAPICDLRGDIRRVTHFVWERQFYEGVAPICDLRGDIRRVTHFR
jgi:hypothetical protein